MANFPTRAINNCVTATTDDALVDLLGETRARVVELVHARPRTVSELAAALELSDVAVRRHVRELVDDGLLEGHLERRSRRGRPGTRYALTERGERLFPDRSAALAGELLEFLETADELDRFLSWRRQRQRERYAQALEPVPDDVEWRAQALADELTADGYQAGVERTTDERGRTVLRLVQQHCAIRGLAEQRPELCGAEERLFGDLLGAGVIRRETQAGGATACVCDIPVESHDPSTADITAGAAREYEGERGQPRAERPTDHRSDDGDEG